MRLLALSLCVIALSNSAFGQHDQHHSPYASDDSSGIAAISKAELSALQDGAGMGLAKAAELNHFPGPKHVLELADELRLSQAQASQIESIRLEMLEGAKRVGASIIEQEGILDLRFSHQHIDQSDLREITAEIAKLRGDLRFVHLSAHLKTKERLTADQITRYDSLRGYVGNTISGNS